MRARVIYRISLGALSVMTGANCVLAIWVWRKLSRPIQYNVRVIDTPKYTPPTNSIPSVVARPGLLPETTQTPQQTLEAPPRVERWQLPYHFCIVNGKPLAYLNGVYIREGDRHAYGIVDTIYPERIYFFGGNYIDNKLNGRQENDSNSRATIAPPP